MSKPYSYISKKVYILSRRNLKTDLDLSDRILLKKYNYYNLVNAYKQPFIKQRSSSEEEEYKNHVKIKNLEALYVFDTKMRALLLSNILKIEQYIKHNLIDSFYVIHNSSSNCLQFESEYLKEKYYDLTTIYSKNHNDRRTRKFHVKYQAHSFQDKQYTLNRNSDYLYFKRIAREIITNEKDDTSTNRSISSYIENHGMVPLWILVNDLTLGNISYFYTFQTKEVQELFLKRIGFYNTQNINLTDLIFNTSNALKILTLCRNICAHNERLYNYDVNIPLSDDFLSFSECLPSHEDIENGSITDQKFNKRNNARRGIYSFIFSIYIFLDSEDKSKFIQKIAKYLSELQNAVNPDDYTIILSIMRLNFNWADLIKNTKSF